MTCLDAIFTLTVGAILCMGLAYGLGYIAGRWEPRRPDEGRGEE